MKEGLGLRTINHVIDEKIVSLYRETASSAGKSVP